jgi:hypothetical protein
MWYRSDDGSNAAASSSSIRQLAGVDDEPAASRFEICDKPHFPLQILRTMRAEADARSACVYIRQSTPDQLVHNLESQRRQYACACS